MALLCILASSSPYSQWHLLTRTHTHAHAPGSTPQYASTLHILILANHQNGKDTHLRGLRVFGPNPAATSSSSLAVVPATPSAIDKKVVGEELEAGAHQFLPFGGGAETLWRVR